MDILYTVLAVLAASLWFGWLAYRLSPRSSSKRYYEWKLTHNLLRTTLRIIELDEMLNLETDPTAINILEGRKASNQALQRYYARELDIILKGRDNA